MIKNLLLFGFTSLLTTSFSQKALGVMLHREEAHKGYILYAPLFSQQTFLIDKKGQVAHTWKSHWYPAQSVYLLPNGYLLRTGKDSSTHFSAGGGLIEKLDWESKVVWSYAISDTKQKQHHDIYPLPNGNVLALVWEKKTREEALSAGRDPELLGNEIWSEKIIEIKPKGKKEGEIVWEWHVWDHLVQNFDSTKSNYGSVEDSPELLNINYRASKEADWLHFNSVAFNSELNQIIVSNRNLCEIFIIDHSTNKIQAASHQGGKHHKGGDFLYRWGNPEAYQAGDSTDQTLFSQHSANWIGKGLKNAGEVLVFNNGTGRPDENYSSVDMLTLPVERDGSYKKCRKKPYGPKRPSWQYMDEMPERFYSHNVSSAQQLANGNILICEGANGKFFEINQDGEVVWTYINPYSRKGILKEGQFIEYNQVFRCVFYESYYPGLKGLNSKELADQ